MTDQHFQPPPYEDNTVYIQPTVATMQPVITQMIPQQIIMAAPPPQVFVQQVYPQPVYQPPPQKTFGEKFKEVTTKWNIGPKFAGKIRQIEGFDIKVILDDSGSMERPVSAKQSYDDPYATKMSRWDEGKQRLSAIAEIATLMDPNGIDVFPLNRPEIRNVKCADDLIPTLANPPNGGTPLCPVLRKVLLESKEIIKERKVLILIVTDGQPTDQFGNSDIDTLRQILMNERASVDKIFISFLACTDSEDEIKFLNEFDRKIKNIDTVDDYESEKAEVKAKQGQAAQFTYGDYIVKSLIGAVDPQMDNLDEVSAVKPPSGCCTIL